MHANLWIYCLKSRKVLSLYSIMRNTRNMCLWSQTTIISTVLSETFFALARDRLGPVSCPFSLIHFWIADFFSNQGCKSRENCVSKHILVFFPIDKMTYKWGLRLWTYNFSLGSKMLGPEKYKGDGGKAKKTFNCLLPRESILCDLGIYCRIPGGYMLIGNWITLSTGKGGLVIAC